MGRKRGKFKAWPLLLLLAGIYWVRENLGITDVSQVDELSYQILPLLIVLLVIAAIILIIKLLSRKDSDEE